MLFYLTCSEKCGGLCFVQSAAPDRRTPQGQRDYGLLLFLYNTGARAHEAAQLKIGNLELAQAQTRALSSVRIHGKGNKLRRCPLWPHTVSALTAIDRWQIYG